MCVLFDCSYMTCSLFASAWPIITYRGTYFRLRFGGTIFLRQSGE